MSFSSSARSPSHRRRSLLMEMAHAEPKVTTEAPAAAPIFPSGSPTPWGLPWMVPSGPIERESPTRAEACLGAGSRAAPSRKRLRVAALAALAARCRVGAGPCTPSSAPFPSSPLSPPSTRRRGAGAAFDGEDGGAQPARPTGSAHAAGGAKHRLPPTVGWLVSAAELDSPSHRAATDTTTDARHRAKPRAIALERQPIIPFLS
mmetsp:Transcript_13985/g.34156  ORF Transcript_13985/g.34156 Transcript_13985/m.34156 type:complete len:204 (+) Transcript_13985:2215-2826(+)